MRRNHSEFIKQQPFIQSLRTSVNIPKDPAFLEYRRGTVQTLPDEFVFSQKEKSLSKSKICRIVRKQSIGNLKLQQKNHVKAFICENVLEIDFNKICKKNTLNQDLKKDIINGSNTISLDLKTIEILILFVDKLSGKKNFNFFNNFEKDGTKKQNPTKMLISCFQLSIQDPSKVKRTFEINLLQKMEDKQFLRINIIEDFSVDSLYVNGKQIFIEKRQALSCPVQQMIYTFNPWDLINQRKILLQSKIMSERPKSKIKWSSSLNQNSDQNFSQTETKISKISQIQQNYGLRSCKEPILKFSTELKRRSDVSSNQQNKQRNFVNVFSCIQKQQETNSMGSTLQSEKDSTLKQKSIFSRQTTRKNNMISSTNNQKRSSRLYQIEENVQTNRPKSSFKNLKEKNDYFQMKESQRKKSLKKNMQIKTDEPVIRNAQINRKSSEIKLQYGIV